MLSWQVLAILSGLLVSVTAFIEKHLLKKEHATSFTAVTTAVTAIILLAFIPLASFTISMEQVLLTFAASLAFVISNLLVARLYRHGDVSSTAPITGTLPIMFIAILSLVFLGEALSYLQYAAIAVLVISMYFMLSDTRKATPKQFLRKNIQYFIAAGLVFSIGAIIAKYVLYSLNPYTFLILSQIMMSVMIMAYVLARFKTFNYLIRDVRSYKTEIFIFSLATAGYAVLYYVALTMGPVSIAYPLRGGVSILVSVFASSIVFKERIIRRIPLAIVMIIAMYVIII